MSAVYEFLKFSPTFLLATVEDGKPRLHPFGGVAHYEDRLCIATTRDREAYTQLCENPHVEIAAWNVGGSLLRLRARLEPEEAPAARVQFLNENPHLSIGQRPDDENFVVFSLQDMEATLYNVGGDVEKTG